MTSTLNATEHAYMEVDQQGEQGGVEMEPSSTNSKFNMKRCNKTVKYFIIVACIVNLVFVGGGIMLHYIKNMSVDDQKIIVVVETSEISNIVSDKFMSFALDTSLIAKQFDGFDLTASNVLVLASALSKCYLRVGGTAADRLIFDELSDQITQFDWPIDGNSCAYDGDVCSTERIPNFVMNGSGFSKLYKFSKDTGMDLIFDLNVLLRNGTSWDPTNAQKILSFAQKMNFKLGWQLGNEPNAFRHVFGTAISAKQLALDFLTLKRLLSTYPAYNSSLLIGPDVTSPRLFQQRDIEYLEQFLTYAGSEISAITWHQYYLNGREAVLSDFLNLDKFNELYYQIDLIKQASLNSALKKPIWLSETGSAYGGGAPELSDRFIASFLWLDKLGVSAAKGLDVVIRQSFYGGNYGLIDKDLQPNPDFWISYVYKKLVGREVLNCTTNDTKNRGVVRVYAHCTSRDYLKAKHGAITFFAVNLGPNQIELSFQGTHNVKRAHRYILTGETGLQSKTVLLNGVKLEQGSDLKLPELVPQVMSLDSPIKMPPYSIGFWILHGANPPVCQSSYY